MQNERNTKNNNRKKRLWITTSLIFIILIIILGFIAFQYTIVFYGVVNKKLQPKAQQKRGCVDCVRRNLDGVYVERGRENLSPVAVIIENHIDSRPQSNLAKANVVYEAETEGRITRFLAIFDIVGEDKNLKKIGPIRSARPYFIDWARELSALFVHVGGSPASLAKLARENIFNLNEFYQGDFFWRNKTIPAPHNVYTSSDNINEYFKIKNIKTGKFLSWRFKDDSSFAKRRSAQGVNNQPVATSSQDISVGFKSPDFMVQWKYDIIFNEYIRYMSGRIHKDAEDEEIRAKNVIIEYLGARVIDKELRLKMDNIGKGKAIICLDGYCYEGEWRKRAAGERTRFYKKDGKEFQLNAGTTWIEVVRPETLVRIIDNT